MEVQCMWCEELSEVGSSPADHCPFCFGLEWWKIVESEAVVDDQVPF